MDIDKQIAYWRDSSDEDWRVAYELVELGRTRHGLFFAHLALEKMLKAHVCRATRTLAPNIHNLVRLAELASLSLTKQQRASFGRLNQYQLEGRYPSSSPIAISQQKALSEIEIVEELLEWLKTQF